MTKCEKGDIVVYKEGGRYLEVQVTSLVRDHVFTGIILASSDHDCWPIGTSDAWAVVNFYKKTDIDQEFNKALDKLEVYYGKI